MGTRHQGVPGMPGAPRWVVPTWDTSRTPFFFLVLVLYDNKNLYILPEPVDHRIAEKSSILFSCCFLRSSKNMSSQDSDGESYVLHLVADPRTYGDLSPYGRTTDDEEDAHLMRIDDSSSVEEDAPLPQPGDIHVKFKKSSLPKRANRSKNLSIPSRFRQESKGDLCDKILKLELEVDDLKEEIALLNYNIKKLKAQLSPPSSSSPPKENGVSGMGTPLGFRQAWGGAPVSYHPTIFLLLLILV